MEEPEKVEPSEDWEHWELYDRVKDAVFAVPSYFNSDINIEGIDANDLPSLNSILGATIEDNFVATLNSMRSVWDPNDEYSDCSFIRQPQTFPDVIFVRHQEGGENDPIMGIELKGWYLLSKEKEPSYRFKVNEDACAKQDLVVVFSWSLSNVLSGEPVVHEPFMAPAKYAAQYVDYYWKVLRDTDLDTTIERPETDVEPYPGPKTDKILDSPVSDSGGNYGRLARSGLMDEYKSRMLNKELGGIRSRDWIKFLIVTGEEDTQSALDNF